MANESEQARARARNMQQCSDLLQLLQCESNCMSTHTGIEHNSIPETNILSILNLPLYACIVPLSLSLSTGLMLSSPFMVQQFCVTCDQIVILCMCCEGRFAKVGMKRSSNRPDNVPIDMVQARLKGDIGTIGREQLL